MAKNELLGPWGERCAAEYLRRRGFTLVACNYRCRFGEIDIIARNREYLTFVEVKLRKSDAFGEAREFVDARKQGAHPRDGGALARNARDGAPAAV